MPNASQSEAKEDLQALPLARLREKLTSPPDGLSQNEAQRRLATYGPQNKLTLAEPFVLDGISAEDLILAAALVAGKAQTYCRRFQLPEHAE